MRLNKVKNRYGVTLCITLGILMSAAVWYFSAPGQFPAKPVKEPALEVTDYQLGALKEESIRKHIVQEGETLSLIAEKYQIDVDTLKGANESIDEWITPGQELVILPYKGVVYRVKTGDSLWEIARMFNVDTRAILKANRRDGDLIESGENLVIPGAKPAKKAYQNQPVSRKMEGNFALPATGEISSPFGWRWGRLHQGIDIADDYGTPVTAALDGKVVYAGWISGYGYSVMLEHRNGYSTLYGHMQRVLVDSGQMVSQGESIGQMGSTGNSTGPHVHFEVRKNGAIVNPINVLR